MTRQEIFDKFIELMGRFAEIRAVAALRDGFVMTTPFTICGSVFLLLANFPIPGYADFMASIFGKDWTAPLNAVAGGTFNVLSFIIVFAVAYTYSKAQECDAGMAGLLALAFFIIVNPDSLVLDSGEVASNVILKTWVGSNGVIMAIIIALVTGRIFCYCEKNHVGIKMPDAVPSGVAKAFEALAPGMIIFTLGAIVFGLCHFIANLSFPELIFHVIQIPLQGLTDSIFGGLIIAGLQSILFWAGIHGPNIIGGIVSPMLIANALDNQSIIDAGMQLYGNPNMHIVTQQFNDVFFKSGGCGMTLGFLIASWFSAKSTQMKSLTKLASVPGLFNINEPLIFGLPIVFNAYLLVPFILVPIIAFLVTYFAIAVGFMPPLTAVQVPWTTPPVIAGFLLAGWQGAVVQIINIAISTVIYFPFVRSQDKAMLKEETDGGANS